MLWNIETLETQSTPEEHTVIITDVRFRPNSTQLATSSFDTTVRLWDAADVMFCFVLFIYLFIYYFLSINTGLCLSWLYGIMICFLYNYNFFFSHGDHILISIRNECHYV